MSIQEMSSIASNTNPIFSEFTSTKIPSFSKDTIKIFTEQNFILPNYIADLKGKVCNLEQTQTKLLNTREHSSRDKIISLLATILAVCILTGGILGTYYASTMMNTVGGQVAVALVSISSFLVMNILTQFYNHKWSDNENEGVVPSMGYLDPLIMPIIGPFIPVWKTYGDESRYQQAGTQKAEEIQKNVEEAKKFFIHNHEQAATLLPLLKKGISDAQRGLENAKTLSIKSLEAEAALSTTLEQLTKAAEELEAAMNFFLKE